MSTQRNRRLLDTAARSNRAFDRLSRRTRTGLTLLSSALLLAAAPRAALAQVDLVLNVTDTPDPVPATGLVTYGVVIANNGLTTATGVTYTMTVPANTSYQGFTAGTGGSCSGMTVGQAGPGTVTCTHPAIAFNTSGNFNVLLRLNAQGITTVASTVSSTQPDAVGADNSVSNQTTVNAGADFSVTLTAPASLASGSTFNFGLSVTNAGPDAATSLDVQFPLPSGFTQNGSLPAGCSVSSGTITCSVAGPIASGGTVTIGNIPGKITAGSPSTVTASASVALSSGASILAARDPNTANNTSVASISVTAGSDVRLTMSRSVGGPYFVGDAFNFVLTAAYDGDVPSTLTITDVVPANYTVGTIAASQNGWSCSKTGQTVTCTRATGGTAGFNQSLGFVTIPVTVATASGGVTNSATISSASPTDPSLANNTATDGGTALLTPSADLAISKTGPNPALVVIGVPFDWTLAVSNGGPSRFFGDIVITESIPAGITINSYTLNGWSCSPAAPVTGAATITCSRTYTSGASLASGSTTPSLVLNATATAAGALTNQASIATVNANVADLNASNDQISHTVTASTNPASADLSVLKSVDLATVAAGDVLTYTLEVVNTGSATATSVTLTDALTTLINNGAGATGQGYVGETVTRVGVASAVNCSNAASGGNGRTLTCTIPSLPVCTAGVDCPQVQVAIRPGGDGGSRSNTASAISSAIADPNTANNSATITSTISPRADVTITKTANPSPIAAGQTLTYVVTAINNGPSAAANVTIDDVLPLNVYFVSANPSTGSCSTKPTANSVTAGGNRTVSCNLGTIANGSQQTVTIAVLPTTATRGTTLTNDADVSTSTIEPAAPGATNNHATANATVSNPVLDILVNNIDSVDPLTVGSNTVHTITVSNTGPSDAENVVIRDTLPAAGLSFQSYTIPAGSCSTVPAVNSVGGVLVCTVPRLAAGASANLAITMTGVTKGVYTNFVTIESAESLGGYDLLEPNNHARQATTVRTRADVQVVSKIASAASVAVRRPYSWTIKVRNNSGAGLAEADTVIVTDNLPATMELTGTPTVALVSGSTTLSTCTGSAGSTSFSCALGTVSSGGEVDITVPVRNLSTPVGGTTTNSASVTTASQDADPLNNTNSGSTTITGATLSGLVFRDFNNNGTSNAGDTGIGLIGLTLTGTAFDGASLSFNTSTLSDGTYAFTGIPEGTWSVQRGTVSETYLTVGQQSAGTSGGTATTPPNITGVALAQNAVATGYNFAFVPQARLGLAKTVVGTPIANANGTITAVLRIRARNYSLEALNSVTITDALTGAAPAFGTYVAGGAAASLAAGNYTINATPSVSGTCVGATMNAAYDGSGSTQVATIASLASLTSCDIDFTLRYKPTDPLPGGNYTNQASATSTGALSGQTPSDVSQNGTNADPDGDGNPGNNSVPTPLGAVLAADVTTAVTLPGSVAAGQPVAGTVSFSNLGPYTAQSVTYSFTMSTGLAGVTFGNLPSGATASYNATNGVVTLTGMPTTLAPSQIASGNGTGPITVAYTQNAIANSTISSTIATTSNEGLNVGPNSATATVTGPLIADVTTTLAFGATANAGVPISGTVVFTNNGPSVASGMTYALALSTGLGGVSFSNLPGGATASYNSVSGAVTFTGMPATLAQGAIASGNGTSGIVVNYTQNGIANSNVSSTVGTSTSQGANVAPDNATVNITGILIADVTTTLTFPGTVNAGNTVSGTIGFTNNGPSVASGVTYAMTLTTGLSGVTFGNLPGGATATYNSVTGAVTFSGMPATLALGAIASGNGTSGITLSYTQPGSATSTITSAITTTTNQGVNAAPDNAIANTGGVLIADVRAQVNFPASVNAGQTVSGTVRYSNTGPSVASNVGYTLTMTTGLTGVTFSNLPVGATASYNSTTGVVTFTGMPTTLTPSQVASGDGVNPIGVTYTQNGVANSTITATISTSTNQGANLNADSDTATVTGIQIADVTTTLTGFPAVVAPGLQVTGRLVYRNAGPSTAAAATFGLTLSSGLTGVTLGNLPAGATASYNSGTGAVTFAGMPASIAAGIIVSGDGVNGISIAYAQLAPLTTISSTIATSTNQGANVLPDVARVDVNGLLGVDLGVTKRANQTDAAPGETITYTVRATNLGPLAVPAGATLTDAPSNGQTMTGVACTNAVGNLCTNAPIPSQLIAGALLPPMAVSAFYEVTVSAFVTAQNGETLSNVAQIGVPFGYQDTNASNDRAVAGPLPVRVAPDLAITKTVSGTFVTGGTATYTLTVRNVGTVATSAPITVSDNLHASLQFLRGAGTGWSCGAVQQAVTCTTTSTLDPGASTSVQLDARIAGAATGAITNVANVATNGDRRPANDTSAVGIFVQTAPDLAVLKTLNTDTLRLGGTAVYTVSATNNGGGATTGAVQIVDDLPAGIVPTSALGTDFTCTIAGQHVACTKASGIGVGQSAFITINVTVSATQPIAPVTNTACATTAGDANTSNDCGAITTPVGGRREAEITKLATGTFALGQPGTYRILVRNRGTLPLAGPFTIADSLPNGLTLVSAQGTGWTCNTTTGVAQCSYGNSIAPGDTALTTLVANVGATALPTVTNCATLTAPSGTTLTNGGRSCAVVTPASGPDLAMTKTVNTDTLRVGGTSVWTLSVTNRGVQATSQPITVTDTLAATLQPLSATGTGFTCTIAGQVVQCARTTPIAVNETVAIAVSATVRTTAPLSPIANTACVVTSNDANATNNCGTITTPTGPRREATIRKEAFGDFVVGEKGNFRIWVRNTGTGPLTGPIVVTDSLPAGLTFAAASGTGWTCTTANNVVRCSNNGPIAAGDSSAVTLQATIGAAAVPSVTNCATLTLANGAVVAGNARSCVTVNPTGDYRLVLELTTPRYQRELGEQPDFTVLVRNVGRSPLPNVVVTNALPAGFTYVAGTSTRGGTPDLTARVAIPNPSGGAGPTIGWPVGDMTPGEVIRIDYRALIRVGASFNVDNITKSTAVSSVPGLLVTSNTAAVPIKLDRGVFDARGVIAGKVYVECDCTNNTGQGDGEVGIPGVRVVLEDGTGAITDVEGKYNFVNVRAGLHVVKVDRSTLPPRATLVTLSTRNAGDGYSRFVDLKEGELARADFADGSHVKAVLDAVLARRREGEVNAARDSARAFTALDAPLPMTSTLVSPSATNGVMVTPFLITPLTGAMPAVSVYTPLAVPNALHDGNSSLPMPVARAIASLDGLPSDSGTGRTTREVPYALNAPNGGRYVPAPRPFMMTGLLEGRIDLRRLSRGNLDIGGLDDGFEDRLVDISTMRDSGRVRAGARAALMLKGDVRNLGLLTLAYDTEHDPDKTQFRDITPYQGFGVFGDASLREFDAQSQQRLYARLDRGASYLRYGDFATPRSDDRRLLLAYDRTMTGLTYHGENTRAMIDAFASRNSVRQTVDELPGRGVSGPYYLAHADAVVNSERVEIVTRDRNQPALILRTQPMARFTDYDVEPLTGRLMFRAPVASLDANLNPTSIRVSYEVKQGGDQFYTYGGDARVRAGSHLELGGFAVRDENPLDKQTLLGVNVTALFGTSTTVLGEAARTETGATDLTGNAYRLELRHQSKRFEGRIFAIEGDTSFANRSSTFAGGRTEYGLRWSASLNTKTRFIAEGMHTSDERTDGRRDGASLSLERRFTSRLVGEVGYRWADENGVSVAPLINGSAGGLFGTSTTSIASGLTPLSFSAARARLTARVPGSEKSTLFAEYEYGLDHADVQRGSLGGEYLLMNKARLYARHEWISSQQGPYALNENRDQQNTVFGIDADYVRNGQVFSEYRARDAFNGRDAEASMGLRNRWVLKPGLLANTSFERVSPISGTTTGNTFALTGALEWTQSAVWKGTSRFEWRSTPTGDSYLGSLGYARKLSRDWTMLGRSLWDESAANALRGRSQLGFAWRQTDVNHVNALFRLENRLDRTDASGATTDRSMANIASAVVNVQPAPAVTLSARYAGKLAADTRDGATEHSSAHLLMGRTIVDVTKRLDVGIIGSVLGNGAFDQRRYGVGGELGVAVLRNLRLAAGYNLFGFTDRDFASLGYTQHGPYVEFGYKFDEGLLGKGRNQ